MLILGASAWALQQGIRRLPPRSEATMHFACLIGGLAAFVGFYIACADINAQGYNAETEKEAQQNAIFLLHTDDDHDDDNPSKHATSRFELARTAYDTLEQRMLQAWVGLLGIAVVLWVGLRWAYNRVLSRWADATSVIAVRQASDEWASTRKSLWASQWELTAIQKDAYAEVARPLEPFVIVFILFGVPATVMASDKCRDLSGANANAEVTGYRNADITCVAPALVGLSCPEPYAS